MDARTIREFVSRDWQSASRAKADYWVALYRDNPDALWDSVQALLAHVRRVQPDFPSDEAREADLSSHLALRSRLDCAAHAFSGR
ncbi:MAG TPA: hypothetical protein VH762_18280 [Gemmatimonadaceae bacterium]|jgi:hypothetical protein